MNAQGPLSPEISWQVRCRDCDMKDFPRAKGTATIATATALCSRAESGAGGGQSE